MFARQVVQRRPLQQRHLARCQALQRAAVGVAAPLPHLGEHDHAALPGDQIDLPATNTVVAGQQFVPQPQQVRQGTVFGGRTLQGNRIKGSRIRSLTTRARG